MSDGMAFLTGAAFAGVAVLFMLKGGDNMVTNNLPSPRQLPIAQANPYDPSYNPYVTPSPTPAQASPSPNAYTLGQQLDNERLKALFEQQRTETEQLKAQIQKQQMIIDNLTGQTDPNNRNSWSKPVAQVAPNQEQDNPLLSGLIWALGGMAVTISGGVAVVGALAVLSRQQRPPRTTYVVQQPYTALPPSMPQRRRAEIITPHYDERQVDYVEYDR